MRETGWVGEAPDGGPAMPVTEMLADMQQRGPGDVLAVSMARARGAELRQERDEAAAAVDPDEYSASFLARGYTPGTISQLSMKLADAEAELAAEEDKIERFARRQAIAMREHAAGRLDAWAVQRMLDGDQGDAHRAEQLERRAGSLRRQIAEAAQLMAPQQQRDADPLEAASRRAHEAFAEHTRTLLAEAQARPASRPATRPERRPFVSRSGTAVRSEFCVWCTKEDLDDDTSYLLHSDPEYAVPVTSPEQLAQLEQAERRAYGYAGGEISR